MTDEYVRRMARDLASQEETMIASASASATRPA